MPAFAPSGLPPPTSRRLEPLDFDGVGASILPVPITYHLYICGPATSASNASGLAELYGLERPDSDRLGGYQVFSLAHGASWTPMG